MAREEKVNPFLTGNYAPIHTTLFCSPCNIIGQIPEEFIGGQYVRNGSNPLRNDSKRDFHWFDGDGMLTGVYFERILNEPGVQALFSNQYIVTDIYRAARKSRWTYPLVPSVATLVNPVSSSYRILYEVIRSMVLILASIWHLISRPIKRVSAANTNILYHDGRIIATMEIGPPMRVYLPSLKTVGWFTGIRAEGEYIDVDTSKPYFGGQGVEGFYKEMTTAHPRVDSNTGELLLFHSTFLPPFVHYSIVPPAGSPITAPRLNQPVPGFVSGKMMHDFGVSRRFTIMIDPPLSLDPFKLRKAKPVVEFDPAGCTRLGVFPRYSPDKIRWYETDACVIMHTANCWDEGSAGDTRVHVLLCRMNSIAPLYHMGGLEVPANVSSQDPECCLYYYQFSPFQSSNQILQQWALSAIPFEFPHVPRHLGMSATQFIYGCSMRNGNFAASIKSNVKIDCLVKFNVKELLIRAESKVPAQITGCVDERSISEILTSQDLNDPIKVFALPNGYYAQECSFVPRRNGRSEDDGWLVTYVFDETQIDPDGNIFKDARSELWIIDAVEMKEVISRVVLPQRVPYGMHGNWFPEEQILNQRDVSHFRTV